MLLANMFLLRVRLRKTKIYYYMALEECQGGWHDNKEDVTPFIKHMLRIILAAYRDFEERIELVSEKLSQKKSSDERLYSKVGKLTKK